MAAVPAPLGPVPLSWPPFPGVSQLRSPGFNPHEARTLSVSIGARGPYTLPLRCTHWGCWSSWGTRLGQVPSSLWDRHAYLRQRGRDLGEKRGASQLCNYTVTCTHSVASVSPSTNNQDQPLFSWICIRGAGCSIPLTCLSWELLRVWRSRVWTQQRLLGYMSRPGWLLPRQLCWGPGRPWAFRHVVC